MRPAALHLVVDHGPFWVPPEVEARAREVVAANRAATAPRIAARARRRRLRARAWLIAQAIPVAAILASAASTLVLLVLGR